METYYVILCPETGRYFLGYYSSGKCGELQDAKRWGEQENAIQYISTNMEPGTYTLQTCYIVHAN